MIGYQVTGPAGTRFADVRLRLIAYHPQDARLAGDSRLKVVLQSMDGSGMPIAEDPILSERMTALDLVGAMSISRRQGWGFE